jgi:hypothetical protein
VVRTLLDYGLSRRPRKKLILVISGSFWRAVVRVLFSTPGANATRLAGPEPGGKQFQKMDCAAPASFTHTHTDIRGMPPPSRHARELAEGQKKRERQAFSHFATPPARQINWRRGSISREKTRFSAFWRRLWQKGSPMRQPTASRLAIPPANGTGQIATSANPARQSTQHLPTPPPPSCPTGPDWSAVGATGLLRRMRSGRVTKTMNVPECPLVCGFYL